MKKKLLLIDGNSIFHRSYHAIPSLLTSSGEPVNAAYGFASMLLYALENERPDYICVAFDKGKKTFRAKMYTEYKAHRPPAPDDLYVQLPHVKRLLDAFGIVHMDHGDYEADDIIGTLSHKAHETGEINTVILSSDMDNLQLVKEDIWLAAPKGFKESTYYTPREVKAKYGLTPTQFLEYKGLKGDASDNIPGVRGVGDKTAVKLLQEFDSIKGVYENIDKLKGAVKKRMEEGKEMAELSKTLATIVIDGPFDLDLEKLSLHHNFDTNQILELLDELEFKQISVRFMRMYPEVVAAKAKENSEQIALF